LKFGFALLIEGDEFTIDHSVARQAGERFCDVFEALREVNAAPRVEDDLAIGLHSL
jgi:hypothetical protein